MMTLRAGILGIIQGVTEFLPISSSGHLLLAKRIFGWQEFSLTFDILLHCATLLVVLYYFRARIIGLLLQRDGDGAPLARALAITTVTTAILGVVLPLYIPLNSVKLTAYAYIGTALLLIGAFLHSRFGKFAASRDIAVNWKIAVLIGVFQGIAVLPGVSRAGATIAIALLCGVKREAAFEYSFLAAIPIIVGALLWQVIDGTYASVPSVWAILGGMVAAMLSGYASLRILRYLNVRGRMVLFAPYLLFLSVLCFLL